jgi:GH25 family lysozyme M1 (1,4-beta-N-acetylmuramidase)
MSEVFGIDVSHHQGKIDWQQVAADGKKFAILKCQYEAMTHRKDEFFEANYEGAGQNGIARGVYIYIARGSMMDPVADAMSLLKHLNGRNLEYGIWLDLEDKSLESKGKAYIRDLSYQYTRIFMDSGYYVGIYCNRDWYIRLIHDDLKKDFDFWIARYPRQDFGKYNPQSSLKPKFNGAVAWQYSSKGSVSGIDGDVDLDYAAIDYSEVIMSKGFNGY